MRVELRGTPFAVTPIAETGDRFTDFAPYVAAVADDGTVCFQAALAAGGSGVFTGSGGIVSSLAEPNATDLVEVRSHPDADDGGTVAFFAESHDGEHLLHVVRDREIETVARSVGPLGPTARDGLVVFRGTTAAGNEGIFAFEEGEVRMVAEATGGLACFHGLPVSDGGGAVTFRADGASRRALLRRVHGATETTLVEAGTDFEDLGRFPVTTDAGVVAFCGTQAGGEPGVFAWRDGEVTTVIAAGGAFESLRGVLVAEDGAAVFYGTPRGGSLGIFYGPDPASDCLLGIGGPLLGSVVSDFALNPVSINRVGQLAIRVRLEDGRHLIVRADPA